MPTTYLHLRSGPKPVDLLAARGTVEVRTYATPKATLADLQAACGGYVELIDVAPGVSLWINEEGKLHGLPLNDLATAVSRNVDPAERLPWYIVGDALLEVRS